jgi:hypothetical protein
VWRRELLDLAGLGERINRVSSSFVVAVGGVVGTEEAGI